MPGRVWFLARHEVRVFLRSRSNLIWMFAMPLFFMWASGMMAGAGRRAGAPAPAPLVRFEAAQPGPVLASLTRHLEQTGYRTEVVAPEPAGAGPDVGEDNDAGTGADAGASAGAGADAGEKPDPAPPRAPAALIVRVPAGFEASVTAAVPCTLTMVSGRVGELGGRLESGRLRRGVVRTIGDRALLAASDSGVTAAGLERRAAAPPSIRLRSEPAFAVRQIPSGYAQSVPGTLVMFIMLVLLTGGTEQLFSDRKEGRLRRLASSPLRRAEIVISRVVARAAIALLMAVFALLVGRLLFGIDWGGVNAPFVLVVLAAYALAIAALAVVMGSVVGSMGQAIGLGVIGSIVTSALGGCWWPIEIVPRAMQAVALALPTGWAMQGLHRLMELGRSPASALPAIGVLLGFAVVFGVIAAKRFRFS